MGEARVLWLPQGDMLLQGGFGVPGEPFPFRVLSWQQPWRLVQMTAEPMGEPPMEMPRDPRSDPKGRYL